MTKRLIYSLLLIGATGFSSRAQSIVNDTNTPLHLLQPAYQAGYGIPSEEEVKSVMDRVLHYIESETPVAMIDGDTGMEVTDPASINELTRLKKGGFRLTSYEWGVTYSGALAAHASTGDQAYRDYTLDRLRFLAEYAPAFRSIYEQGKRIDGSMRSVIDPRALDDAGAICCSMIKAQLLDPSLNLYPLIENYIDYILNKQYRLDDGTLARIRPQKNTVWLDDMYMGIPAIAWMGKLTGDQKYYDEACRQLLLFADKMWVPEKKLFRHGWVEAMDPHPSFHWGRANGWAIFTMCEVLEALPEDHPQRQVIMDLFRKHAEGLASLQNIDGLWHQLLDNPATYPESSATAIFVGCLAHAVNRGWIDAKAFGPIALQGWHGIEKSVNEEGQVENVCVGTGMGFDPSFYAYRPVHAMAAHGYGPVLWAGSKIVELLHAQHPKLNDSAVQFYENEVNTSRPIFNYNE